MNCDLYGAILGKTQFNASLLHWNQDQIVITNLDYIGDQQLRSEKLDIIDLVSSMTFGHILRARSSCTALRQPSLLISIKGQMRVIRDKMPKYKSVLDNILMENDLG